MSYFAAVFARTPQGWIGDETTLEEVTGVDDLAEQAGFGDDFDNLRA